MKQHTVTARHATVASIAVVLCMAPAAHAAATISSAATQNMSCTGGVCSPTAKNAVLNVGDLTTMLASGSVSVNTGTGSLAQQVQNIVVSAGFSWSSSSSLTLEAYDSVTVDKPVAVNGTGAVSLVTNNGGTSGNLSFGSKGSLSFLGTANSLTIDGAAFTLENSVVALAAAINSNAAGNYALAHSYDASKDGSYSGPPVTTTLSGAVQGLGNTISNLSISGHPARVTNIGLFADIGQSGIVSNLVLTALSFNASSSHTGFNVGGLAGLNQGTLEYDRTAGSVAVGANQAGGLVGDNQGTIVSSSSSVDVGTKSGWAGGVAGVNHGTILLSSASGSVRGIIAGGLLAVDYGLHGVSQCFSTGRVSGNTGAYLGGLVGESDGGEIENSYATGSVSGHQKSDIGGFLGLNAVEEVSSSYSTGHVSGPMGYSFVGGFVGTDDADLTTNSYWDTTTSGTDDGVNGGNETGLTGLTTVQLQAGLPSGFDPTVWAQSPSINHGLPYLINNPSQ